MSLGSEGCIVQGRDKVPIHCKAPLASVTDTVGAGDYFTAGFLYAYLHGHRLKVGKRISDVERHRLALGKAVAGPQCQL